MICELAGGITNDFGGSVTLGGDRIRPRARRRNVL